MSLAFRLTILFLAASLLTSTASAGLMLYRTQVQASYGSGNSTRIEGSGGPQESSASISLAPFSGGALSQASASLSADGYVPTLRARAVHDSLRAQAVAWGVQGFTNTLGSSLSTTLVINLTADLSGGNDVQANVYLFQDEGFEFYQDNGTMLFESTSMLWPGFKPLTNNLGPTGFDIQRKGVDGLINETRSFDFTVDPGDSFYVWARLVATADNPGQSDAFNTLTASLTNTQGLLPAASNATAVVPEPGRVTLYCMMVLLMLGFVERVRGFVAPVRCCVADLH